jgi:hypothetical protein
VAVFTAEFFRLMDAIENAPPPRCRHPTWRYFTPGRTARHFQNVWRAARWMFWKN